MQTMNQASPRLYARRLITLEEAIGRSSDPEELKNLIANGAARRPAAPPAR